MPPRDRAGLVDILEAARLARSFLENVPLSAFEVDPLRQSAVIRQFEIIGEAATRLSAELRAATPHVPWRRLIGMRNVLIHAYDAVDVGLVYRTVGVSLPELMTDIEALLRTADR